uniref:Ribonuclease DdI-like n=1 Tax=Cicer arietinum TaxID=3827 RepID=A0A1S3EC39_CICAR|nr:ribonuclease DdI-like [Cicer arietinum]
MIMSMIYSIIILLNFYILFHLGLIPLPPYLPLSTYYQSNPLPSDELFLKKEKRYPPLRLSPPPPYVPTFDHFVLAETWPATFCKIKRCVNPMPINFTIHGLWPNNRNSQPRNCQTIQKLDWNIMAGLKNQLNKDWPSLIKGSHNIVFWNEQWTVHGTCSLLDPYEYFYQTLKIYNKHNIRHILRKENIMPSRNPTLKHDIINAIVNHIHFTPQIRCVNISNQFYLYEIRLCLTASNNPQYKNCDTPFINCRHNNVYL